MSNQWHNEKLAAFKQGAESLKCSWDTMGDLSQKKHSEMSLKDLKGKALDVSCEAIEQSVETTNNANKLINSASTPESEIAKLEDALVQINTIVEETKELAKKSDASPDMLEAADVQIDTAAASGKMAAQANDVKELWKQVKIECPEDKKGFLDMSFDEMIDKAFDIYDTAESMYEIAKSDPRKLVLNTFKSELGEKITSSFGSINSVTAGISGVVTSALENDNVTSLSSFKDSLIGSVKGFASDTVSDFVSTNVMENFDLQNMLAIDAGALNGYAGILLDAAESCIGDLVTGEITDAINEKVLSKLGSSASNLASSAKDMIAVSEQSPASLNLDQIKGDFNDKLAGSFGPINAIAAQASQLSAGDGAGDVPNNPFGKISQFAEDASSQIKSASQKAETVKETMDSFDLMQDTAKSAGEMKAYGHSILSLVEKAEASANDPLLIEELGQIKQGANDLLDKADNLVELTQKDPRQISLDQIKSEAKEGSASAAAPIEKISQSTQSAMASGMLDGETSSLFDKIKEKASSAKQSQQRVTTSAESAGGAGAGDSTTSESNNATDNNATANDGTATSQSDNAETKDSTAGNDNTASSENNTNKSSAADNSNSDESGSKAQDAINQQSETKSTSSTNSEAGADSQQAATGSESSGSESYAAGSDQSSDTNSANEQTETATTENQGQTKESSKSSQDNSDSTEASATAEEKQQAASEAGSSASESGTSNAKSEANAAKSNSTTTSETTTDEASANSADNGSNAAGTESTSSQTGATKAETSTDSGANAAETNTQQEQGTTQTTADSTSGTTESSNSGAASAGAEASSDVAKASSSSENASSDSKKPPGNIETESSGMGNTANAARDNIAGDNTSGFGSTTDEKLAAASGNPGAKATDTMNNAIGDKSNLNGMSNIDSNIGKDSGLSGASSNLSGDSLAGKTGIDSDSINSESLANKAGIDNGDLNDVTDKKGKLSDIGKKFGV